MYSIIRFRAGLVALVFALISISFVSAVPIPIPALQSGLSSALLPSPIDPSHDGQNHIQHDSRRIAKFSVNGQMSRAPAATRDLSSKHNSFELGNDQLVRRNIFSKIKKGFQNLGRKIKSGFQKVGQGIKHVAQKIGSGIKTVAQKVGSGIKTAAQKVGSGIKRVAQKVGSGIKGVAQKVGSGIKRVAQKVGSGIKTAAKKVGQFMKTTGAKIAKFGLKVVQSVGTAVGKVASFIPDVGKPLETVIDGVAKGAGFISDKIHVKLPSKLEKGVEIMNQADKYMEYIPRRRDLSDEEALNDGDANAVILATAKSQHFVESIMRVVATEMGSRAALCLPPLAVREVRDFGVTRSLSQAWRIGRAITICRQSNDLNGIAKSILEIQEGKRLFVGKIVDVSREVRAGFTWGEVRIKKLREDEVEYLPNRGVDENLSNVVDEDDDPTVVIPFQNENLCAYMELQDGTKTVMASVPDLITILDSQSGSHLGTPEYAYGLRVTVIALAGHPLWRSKAGLETGGPIAFGLQHTFVPVGEYREPRSVIEEYGTITA